ncbi:MAG: YHYH protein [Granulosicoccus sp.]
MTNRIAKSALLTTSSVALVVMLATACSSDDDTATELQEPPTDSPTTDDTPADEIPSNNTPSVALSCEDIAMKFVTRGSANDDLGLPEPEVSASCVDDNVIVTSNQIPDFPYIETSPGSPRAFDLEYTIPATPIQSTDVIPVPVIGPLGIAINGIPIYAATEGTGGDVLSMPNFIECGGHNGPGGYHYHTFSVVGTDYCLFSEDDLNNGPVLFGYAFDGYPIYSGNNLYTSSWFLSDPTLFATDTLSAHTYAEGSGDLDQCNGRTDEDGNYAYYTTDGFPYTLGCYRGVIDTEAQQRPNGPAGVQ